LKISSNSHEGINYWQEKGQRQSRWMSQLKFPDVTFLLYGLNQSWPSANKRPSHTTKSAPKGAFLTGLVLQSSGGFGSGLEAGCAARASLLGRDTDRLLKVGPQSRWPQVGLLKAFWGPHQAECWSRVQQMFHSTVHRDWLPPRQKPPINAMRSKSLPISQNAHAHSRAVSKGPHGGQNTQLAMWVAGQDHLVGIAIENALIRCQNAARLIVIGRGLQ